MVAALSMNSLRNDAKLRAMNERNFVLDASAVLAFMYHEQGAERVAAVLPSSSMSAVNLSEVVAKLSDDGVTEAEIAANLADLDLEVVPFDQDLAVKAGALRPVTRSKGLSLGDRACLATAQKLALPVLTADKVWAKLDLEISIEIIR